MDTGWKTSTVRVDEEPMEPPELMHLVVRRNLLRALHFSEGSQAVAARRVGLSQQAMAWAMQKHGIPTAKVSQNRRRQITRDRDRIGARRHNLSVMPSTDIGQRARKKSETFQVMCETCGSSMTYRKVRARK
jgi:hypothetical protein